MAVYTLINKHQLQTLLAYYDLGELVDYSPIAAGTTNSNYKITIKQSNKTFTYILTIIEQLLSKSDLEFVLSYAQYLAERGVKMVAPIKCRNDNSSIQFLDKTAILTPFMVGHSMVSNSEILLASHCEQIGKELAKSHITSTGFNFARKNPAGLTWCIDTFKAIDNLLSPDHYLLIKDEIEYLIISHDLIIDQSSKFIKKITGAIHADLFCDNTIFDANSNLAGIFDFYYACTDFYLYDLAMVVNDWTLDFHKKELLCVDRYNSLLNSYLSELKMHKEIYNNLKRSISEIEDFWQIMLRRAALRFWLLRLSAFHLPKGSAVKTIKDPTEYELKLIFHRSNKLQLLK